MPPARKLQIECCTGTLKFGAFAGGSSASPQVIRLKQAKLRLPQSACGAVILSLLVHFLRQQFDKQSRQSIVMLPQAGELLQTYQMLHARPCPMHVI